jgi:PadR family transcriptional regulator, regulatory protein PadR
MAGHDAQMLKGVLSLLLLHLVAEDEDYGYSLVVRLQDHGFADLSEGTVYPALSRMESNGLLGSHLVASTSGPARKYYAITAVGTAELTRARAAWHSLVGTVEHIVPTPTSAPTSARSRS